MPATKGERRPLCLVGLIPKVLVWTCMWSGVRCHQYANDSQFYSPLPSPTGKTVVNLNQCLELGRHWMWETKLRLKPHKTVVVLVVKSADLLMMVSLLGKKNHMSSLGACGP